MIFDGNGGTRNISSQTFYYGVAQNLKANTFSKLGFLAFSRCEKLTSIDIPASVIKIGKYAFWDCDSLQSITFADTTTWYYCDSSLYKNGTQIDISSPTENVTYFNVSKLLLV